MSWFVSLHVRALCGTIWTADRRTLVGFYPFMKVYVISEVMCLREAFPTFLEITYIRPNSCVEISVGIHVLLRCCCHVTFIAFEWFVFLVSEHMSLQVLSVLRGLIANIALVWSQSFVNSTMMTTLTARVGVRLSTCYAVKHGSANGNGDVSWPVAGIYISRCVVYR